MYRLPYTEWPWEEMWGNMPWLSLSSFYQLPFPFLNACWPHQYLCPSFCQTSFGHVSVNMKVYMMNIFVVIIISEYNESLHSTMLPIDTLPWPWCKRPHWQQIVQCKLSRSPQQVFLLDELGLDPHFHPHWWLCTILFCTQIQIFPFFEKVSEAKGRKRVPM